LECIQLGEWFQLTRSNVSALSVNVEQIVVFFHAIHVYRFDQSTRIIKRNLTHSSRVWILSSGIFSLDNEFWDIQFGS